MIDSDRLLLMLMNDIRKGKRLLKGSLIFGILLMLFFLSLISWSNCHQDWDQDTWRYSIYPFHFYITMVVGMSFLLGTWLSYQSEIHRKTIKTLSLYDLTLNDISVAKVVSACTLGVLFSYPLTAIAFAPVMACGGNTAFFGFHVIYLSTVLGMALMLATAVFLNHIVLGFGITKRFNPLTAQMILLILALFMTETVMQQYAWRGHNDFNTRKPPGWAWGMFTSPVHMSGRLAGWALGVARWDASLVVVPAIAIMVVFIGIVVTQNERLDMFTK